MIATTAIETAVAVSEQPLWHISATTATETAVAVSELPLWHISATTATKTAVAVSELSLSLQEPPLPILDALCH